MIGNRLGAGVRHLRANLVAYLALFLTLGGASAYAAGALPKASVGPKQLKTGAVTSPKVRDGSLRAVDFATGQLPGGERGPGGEIGPRGPEGARGPSGYSIFDGPPPSGTTLTGYFTQQLPLATDKKAMLGVSFPVELAPGQPEALAFSPSSNSVPSQADSKCTGSWSVPTAPPGEVCIYSRGSSGSKDFEAIEALPQGFTVVMTSSGGNNDFVRFGAVWAYTAP